MNNCKLSIIIPAYNTASYLERTLNVLVNINMSNYEIIIINDNSNDGTEDIAYQFISKHSNIKYYKNQINQGVGVSRNIGFEKSFGEYITFLDSDDWPDLIAYKTAVDTFENNNDCDCIIWGIKNEYDNKISSYTRVAYNDYHCINKELALSLLCNTYTLDVTISSYLGNKMYRRALIETNRIFFDSALFEDVTFTFKTILYANKIILLPNLYTHYYQRQRSIVHSFTKKHICDMFNELSCIQNIVNNNYPIYKKDFYSLVEKCSKTLFKIMYDNIESPSEQKQLLCYYFENLLKYFSINEILDYLDAGRIKKVLLN